MRKFKTASFKHELQLVKNPVAIVAQDGTAKLATCDHIGMVACNEDKIRRILAFTLFIGCRDGDLFHPNPFTQGKLTHIVNDDYDSFIAEFGEDWTEANVFEAISRSDGETYSPIEQMLHEWNNEMNGVPMPNPHEPGNKKRMEAFNASAKAERQLEKDAALERERIAEEQKMQAEEARLAEEAKLETVTPQHTLPTA